MNEERPLKIWGQPDPEDADSRKVNTDLEEAKEADSSISVTPEKEIVLTDLQDERETEKKGFFRRNKDKEDRKSISDLKQMGHRERVDYLKDSSVATRDSILKTTEAAIQSDAGRKARGLGYRLSRYLKTYRGKRVATLLVLLIIALIGARIWMKGSDLRQGVKLCEQGYYVDAVVPLKNAVEKDNMNPKTYNMLGMAYLGSGEYEDALNQFQLAQNLDPESQDAWRGMGITYYYTGEYEKAVSALNTALENCDINVNNTEYDIMWYRASAESAMKDYKAAESTYNALLELEGESAALYYYRGENYCRMNDKDKAVEDFNLAAGQEGNSYDLYFDIYNSLMERGWTKEAVSFISLCKDPANVDTTKLTPRELNLYQGMMLYLEGSYKEAVNQLSAEELKEDYQALAYKALAYEGMDKPKKALSAYKNLLSLYPSIADSYNAIAMYYLRNGKEKKAISYLEKGVNNCPAAERQILYYNMVTAYEQAGDFKGAQDALRQYGVLYGQSKIKHENYYAKERDRS